MLGLLPRTMCRNEKYKDDKILYVNRSLKALSEKRGFTFLDLYSEFEGKAHMSNNRVHLNRAGARTLGTCVSIAILEQNEAKPTANDQNSPQHRETTTMIQPQQQHNEVTRGTATTRRPSPTTSTTGSTRTTTTTTACKCPSTNQQPIKSAPGKCTITAT